MWTSLWVAWGILSVVALAAPEAKSVPVVPNFSQESFQAPQPPRPKSQRSSTQEYRTGYEYSVSGTNIKTDAAIAPMGLTTTSNTIQGITSKWTSIDAATKPTWTIVNEGEAMQFRNFVWPRFGEPYAHQP